MTTHLNPFARTGSDPAGARSRKAPMTWVACLIAICIVTTMPRPSSAAFEWTLESVPTSAHLKSVWGASPTAVFAVGDSGTVLRFDGTSWSKMTFPFGNVSLNDVWGSSATDVYAVGGNRVYRSDGSTWSEFSPQPFPPGVQINAIWGTSPNHIVLVGTGDIVAWNGTQWTVQMVNNGGRVVDVWGNSPNDVFMVEKDFGRIYRWFECTPGSGYRSWNFVDVSAGGMISLWGTGPDDVYLAGSEGFYHWGGGPTGTNFPCQQQWSWTGPHHTMSGIWGRAADDIYAVGWSAGGTSSYIVHYDGTNWVDSPAPQGPGGPTGPAFLRAVWGDHSGDFWAVGDRGTVLRNIPTTPDTTLIVNSTGCTSDNAPGDGKCDTGLLTADGQVECTLCAAIQEANADPDLDVIRFDIHSSDPGYRPADGTFEIACGLPATTSPVTIDGATQPGYVSRPKLAINGTGRLVGITLSGGSTTLRGFVIGGVQGPAIQIDTKGGNTIVGCYLGTDGTGAAPVRNRWGILINDSPGNTIGGIGAGDGNVISGNGLTGVEVFGAASIGNRIIGNRIGLDASGTHALPNEFHGVLVDRGAKGTVIGGASAAERNLISGNSDHAIAIEDAQDTRVVGNHIGVDVTGNVPLGNQKGGIVVEGASLRTTIGGTISSEENIISANVGHGIAFFGADVHTAAVHRNLIGLDRSGSHKLPNSSDGIRIEDATGIKIGDGATHSGNTIAGNSGMGIRLKGASTRDITIEDNRIGYHASPDTTREPNLTGPIWIEGGVEDVTIGGLDADQWNRVYGNVLVFGATTRRVRFIGNDLATVPSTLGDPNPRLAFDLGGDGPTCNCWEGSTGHTNDGVATPRLTRLSTGVVEGLTKPGATVSLYRVLGAGSGRYRYFAHTLEPLKCVTAGDDGAFVMAVAGLGPGDQVVANATDRDGNSSEMTQLKRPIIFAHGIGGSWLVANDGTEIWLPNGLTAPTQNANLRRMGFNADGTSLEPIVAREMLEGLLGQRVVYGPIMDWFASHGYAGEARNLGGADMDAWRYWYDWRRSPADAVQGLKAMIDRVTGTGTDVARSCEVDLVAHSNGGMVANAYIRGEPAHSRCRVHRYVTMGIPVLGAPLAAGAHTRGYIFGLEHEPIYGWIFAGGLKVNWGQMIEMGRNLPAAYCLLPSEKYWAANRHRPNPHYLEDLNGQPLTSHQKTIEFMGAPKLDAQDNPLGLARNIPMWSRELERVHALADDWTDYQGPPQVFRVVGSMPRNTIESWTVFGDPPSRFRYHFVTDLQRWEPGDTYEHWSYRLRLTPVLGAGDGTVPLSSATLGHWASGADFSGVGRSRWIEDFQYFPCKHNDMLLPECAEGELQSLEYVTDVLHSGYEVPAAASVARIAPASVAGPASGAPPALGEIVYVTAPSPITVRVEDAAGHFDGPPDPAEPERIEYQLPEVTYWSSSQTACLSFSQAKTYTVTISALADPADVQVVRIVSDGGTGNQNVLFPRAALAAGGVLRMTFPAGGAPASAPLALDATGDGAFESNVDPAASAMSTSSAPAIPLPQPFRLNLVGYRGDVAPRVGTVRFPDVGGATWGWATSTPPAWLSPAALAGTTPDSLVFSYDASAFASGTYVDSLTLTLTLGAFTTTARVDVSLHVLEAPSVAQLALSPPYVVLHPGERHTFDAQGFDETGMPLVVTPAWTAEGGTIDGGGTFTAGAFNGLYFVKVRSGSVEAEAVVEIVGGAELTTTPAVFGLHQNFPNPFSAGTVIAFDVATPTHVRLTMYDVRGRVVSTLEDAEFPAGRHTHALADPGLSTGVYFYRVEMGAFSQTRKMAVVR